MKPYYEADGITIYHGDCRELTVAADALIADPPYGVAEPTDRKARGRGALAECNDFPAVAGDDEPFDPAPWLGFPVVVLWGANHFADRVPPSSRWLVWDKRDGIPSNDNADCELAWTNIKGPARLYHHMWNGMIKASERDERRVHPTQKPVALMRWVLDLTTKPGDLVFDPFMGSGPIARACAHMGRRYVGCELVEEYCEAAANRLAQGALDLSA